MTEINFHAATLAINRNQILVNEVGTAKINYVVQL